MRKLVIAGIVLVLAFTLASPAFAQDDAIRIYYAGDSKSNVRVALGIAPAGTFTFVEDPLQADVFFLNGNIPQTDLITQRLA